MVVFKKNEHRIELRNPGFQDTTRVQKSGSLGRTAGGKRYFYSKGKTFKTLEMDFQGLTSEEKEALLDFFDNHAEGPKHQFEFIDQYGTEFLAYFNDSEIEFSVVFDEADSTGSFQVNGRSIRDTQRRNPYYDVTVELEIEEKET